MKTAVVIGATGNLGTAVCKALVENGFEVNPHLDPLKPAYNCGKLCAYFDLPKRIDAAIYLAGVNLVKPVGSTREHDLLDMFSTNLFGAFYLAREAVDKMPEGSSFITVSSIMATHPYPHRSVYAACKAGLESLTRSLAVEWGPRGISAHCVRLGHLSKLMKSSGLVSCDLLDAVKENTPQKRLVEPEDFANYVLWLVNGGAKLVNGATSDFDCGYAINRYPLGNNGQSES